MMMNSRLIGHVALLSKTIAILSLLFLDLVKKIKLPLYIPLLFALSGLGLGVIHQYDDKIEKPIYNYHSHNMIIAVFSLIVLIKKLN